MSENSYYLVDLTHNAQQENLMRMCEVFSLICLWEYKDTQNIEVFMRGSDHLIAKYWKFNNYMPTNRDIVESIKTSNIKWFIRNKINSSTLEVKDNWNADFINGLAKCGEFYTDKHDFISFRWEDCNSLKKILPTSPFAGTLCIRRANYHWREVCAFYLKYNEGSQSYNAGVFATGEPITENKVTYAKYVKKLEPFFTNLSVPIEKSTEKYIYISPVWPALFTLYMPQICSKIWLNLKNVCNRNIYCPILWRSYVHKDIIIINGIPYLKGRRTIYYVHKCEEGATKRLDAIRVEKNLVSLANSVMYAVKDWSLKTYVRNNS